MKKNKDTFEKLINDMKSWKTNMLKIYNANMFERGDILEIGKFANRLKKLQGESE